MALATGARQLVVQDALLQKKKKKQISKIWHNRYNYQDAQTLGIYNTLEYVLLQWNFIYSKMISIPSA